MNKDIEFETGKFGLKAIIKTKWKDEFLDYLLDNSILELELNQGKGWEGDNVNFLKAFPKLKSLVIIDYRIKSIEVIQCLFNIEKLVLNTYVKKPIDFTSFPKLTECGFEWINGSDSLFNCTDLISLGINRYNKKNSDDFSKLKKLEKLTILNSPIETLTRLSPLINLVYLSISNLNKLSSLEGIESLRNLETLEIYKCKGFISLKEIFGLKKLKRLLLIDLGNISSINGIENLIELTDFIFYESTNIMDGDLNPILKLKHLENIAFQKRRHYSHKKQELQIGKNVNSEIAHE